MMEWFLTSSVLILVLALLRRMLRGRIGLRFQYALWAVVLLRLLIPWSPVESGISVLNVTKEPEIQAIVDSVREPIRWESQIVEVDQESGETLPVTATHFIANEEDLNHFYSPAEVSFVLWKWGCALLFGFMLTSNLVFLRKLELNRARKKVPGVTIPVYTSPVVETPCLAGFLHPSIYLPEQNWEQTQLWYVIEHELTHYSHKDHLISVLRCVALALHWYNPLVWWAAKASKEDGELACDEGTLARLGEGERIPYGQTLLELTCTSGRNYVMLTATTMTGSKRSLKERIQRIAKKPQMAAVTLIAVIAVMALVVGCTFTGAESEGQYRNEEDPFAHQIDLVEQTEESLGIISMMEDMIRLTKDNGAGSVRLFDGEEAYILELENTQLDILSELLNRYLWAETEEELPEEGSAVSLRLEFTDEARSVVHITAKDGYESPVQIAWVTFDENEMTQTRCYTADAVDENTYSIFFDVLFHLFQQQELTNGRNPDFQEKSDFLNVAKTVIEENEGAGISYVNPAIPILRFELSEAHLDRLLELFHEYTWTREIIEMPSSADGTQIDIWFWDGTVLSINDYYVGILKNGENTWQVWYSEPKDLDEKWMYSAAKSFLEEVFMEGYDQKESEEITDFLYKEILAMQGQAVISSELNHDIAQFELSDLETQFCAEMMRSVLWVEGRADIYTGQGHYYDCLLEGNGCSIRYYGKSLIEYTRDGISRYFCAINTEFTHFGLSYRMDEVFYRSDEGGGAYSFEGVDGQQAAKLMVEKLPQILESYYGDQAGLKAENVTVLDAQWDPYDHHDTTITYNVRISIPENAYVAMELEDDEVEKDGDRIIMKLRFSVEGANESFWICDWLRIGNQNLIPS